MVRVTGPTACKVTQSLLRDTTALDPSYMPDSDYRQWPSTLCIAATRMIARHALSPSSPAPRRWGLDARRGRSNSATVPPMHDCDARECITQ